VIDKIEQESLGKTRYSLYSLCRSADLHATLACNSGKITAFKGVAVCEGLVELRGSELEALKSTFNADNFIRRLSWSISSHFAAIHC